MLLSSSRARPPKCCGALRSTQRETARFLVEDRHAHYLLTVNQHQPTLYEDLSALIPAYSPPTAARPRATGAWSSAACWPSRP
jgi:hypothetical protein